MWWTISSMVTKIVLVAEDDHAEAVADKNHGNAQLVEQLGGRVVVER